MEVNVQAISMKCRLCAKDTTKPSYNIFSTCGLQNKIRKYLQITVKAEDYLPKIVCESCYQILEKFDRLCTIASGAQRELLQMLNNARENGTEEEKEMKVKKKRRKRKKNSDSNEETVKKTRKRRKKNADQWKLEDPVPLPLITDFKLGQIIRDTELIKLILKALKWTENDENVERLRNTDLSVVLSNSDLLHDDDLLRLIKSYMGHDGNNNTTGQSVDHFMDENCVTEIEIKVDPLLFLPEEDEGEDDGEDVGTDDSRTISVDLNEVMANIEEEEEKIYNDERKHLILPLFECTSCPERFKTHVQLQDHVLSHLIKRSQDAKQKPKRKRKLKISEEKESKGHINQHTAARPFKCVACDKKFASSGNCLTHKKRMHPELFPKKTVPN